MSTTDADLSRLVSHALRHQPWLYELELDDEGWMPIDQLIEAICERGGEWASVDRAALEKMLAAATKHRHVINGDRIRAIYGHSIPALRWSELGAEGFAGAGTCRRSSRVFLDLFPESREDVVRIARDYWDTPGIAAYAYASEAFWWPVFEPALSSSAEEATIAKCFDALERMLACPDVNVRDAAGIRVTPYLLDPTRSELVRRYAGPLTLTDLQRAAGP